MLKYWLWLTNLPGLQNQTRLALLRHFGSPEDIYYADEGEILLTEGITRQQASLLKNHDLSAANRVLADCQRLDQRILTIQDAAYPNRLRNIFDPPCLLYWQGKMPALDEEVTVAVVGTRKCTPYGIASAEKLGYGLANGGAVVVSGLAEGIDAAAARSALRAGGTVVGVAGCGLDVRYPYVNRYLYEDIAAAGLLLSEYPPGSSADGWHFPVRNRILAGLAVATLVVEAPEKSGALYTARAALDEGRDVYVVPGNVDMPSFVGSNRLLKEGASPISCGWDVMSEYISLLPDKIRKAECPEPQQNGAGQMQQARDYTPKKKETKPAARKKVVDIGPGETYIDLKTTAQGLCGEDQAIVNCLTGGEKLVDDVIVATGIPSGLLLRRLTMLELKGTVVRLPGNRIRLRK